MEALLHRERYRKLHELLTSGRVEIRVVPKDRVFVHGKAGVIEGLAPAFGAAAATDVDAVNGIALLQGVPGHGAHVTAFA